MSLIKLTELCPESILPKLSDEEMCNLNKTYEVVLRLRYYSRIPMVIVTPQRQNAGFRTREMHFTLYQEIAKKNGKSFDPSKIPMQSLHLFGGAVDIYDPNKQLQKWILANEQIVERMDLFFESFEYTPTWVHLQWLAPASHRRFFIP